MSSKSLISKPPSAAEVKYAISHVWEQIEGGTAASELGHLRLECARLLSGGVGWLVALFQLLSHDGYQWHGASAGISLRYRAGDAAGIHDEDVDKIFCAAINLGVFVSKTTTTRNGCCVSVSASAVFRDAVAAERRNMLLAALPKRAAAGAAAVTRKLWGRALLTAGAGLTLAFHTIRRWVLSYRREEWLRRVPAVWEIEGALRLVGGEEIVGLPQQKVTSLARWLQAIMGYLALQKPGHLWRDAVFDAATTQGATKDIRHVIHGSAWVTVRSCDILVPTTGAENGYQAMVCFDRSFLEALWLVHIHEEDLLYPPDG